MSDERDIDDILESLDQLLRSGSHFNDDHDASAPASAASQRPRPAEPHRASAAEEDMAQARDEPLSPDAYDPSFDLPLDDAFSADDAVHAPDEQIDADAAMEGDAQTAAGPLSRPRVVLTEDMLVDNPQGRLSLRIAEPEETASAQPCVPDETACEPAPAIESGQADRAHFERVVAQVCEDVIAQLQRQLPDMIQQSLDRHLNESGQGEDSPDTDPN